MARTINFVDEFKVKKEIVDDEALLLAAQLFCKSEDVSLDEEEAIMSLVKEEMHLLKEQWCDIQFWDYYQEFEHAEQVARFISYIISPQDSIDITFREDDDELWGYRIASNNIFVLQGEERYTIKGELGGNK